MKSLYVRIIFLLVFLPTCITMHAQPIIVEGQPGLLEIRKAGEHSLRITLKPVSFKEAFPFTPSVAERDYPAPFISIDKIDGIIKQQAGNLQVEIKPQPLSIIIRNKQGQFIQQFTFDENGILSFIINGGPVLGMGEGGPKPPKEIEWRNLPVQYDRSGSYDSMQPRWQSDAYGSRNPAAVLVQPAQWGIFVASPWVAVDLRDKQHGFFIPVKPKNDGDVPQTEKNQGLDLGKGLPPADKFVPGLYDFFVFDAHNPSEWMKDFSMVTGPAAMPPKWALGYMQSHRTLEDDTQMMGIIDSFRSKKIPLDAVIYLGTGFTPRGWNKQQPSFEFNPEVFKHDPKEVITGMHNRNVKVILHMVPWDRDKLPTLHGNIPAKHDEILDASHIQNYWKEHLPLIKTGVDAFWPDEGDWFNLYERIKRHQLYYQGSLSAHNNLRPWSLQRNGYPGIAQWGGWVWSGDTESSWKTLEAQIAVALNYSLSIGPFWGSDIGGFYSSPEKTAELYIRWFQFGSFNALFRSHGRTWMTSLPWGFGLKNMGPVEMGRNGASVLQSEMNNAAEEPITKKYAELHYQLLPYTYTLAWEARSTGMPMMRAMWLHYPNDEECKRTGNQYLWGRDMLIAPVFEKGAISRTLYLPEGEWYDWWTNEKQTGGRMITCKVDLSTMPIYVRAGAIIAFDPIRQYTAEIIQSPTELKIFTGADGHFTLYDDDGSSQDYLKGKGSWIGISWDEKKKQVTFSPDAPKKAINIVKPRKFIIRLIPDNEMKNNVVYGGKVVKIQF
ncbi:MAG TPA: TIM-barrel domain-containing protein [Puia sp.]|nr:TIM-barrel domain-containing protein [Puia sp.]